MKEILEGQLRGRMHFIFPDSRLPLKLLSVSVDCIMMVICYLNCICVSLCLSDLSVSYHYLLHGDARGVPGCTSACGTVCSRTVSQQLRVTCGWRSVCRIFACLGTTMGIWAVLIEQLEMTWTIWVMLFIKCMSHWSAVCYLLEMK